jgi:hypothetical protein
LTENVDENGDKSHDAPVRSVYFDTNVYSHIAQADEVAAIKHSLQDLGWAVVASAGNLFEMYSIPDPAVRDQEVRALTALARHFDDVPNSYREAMEVRWALAKHRPQWSAPVRSTANLRRRRKDHVTRWSDAKRGVFPDPAAFDIYRQTVEAGTAKALAFQRELRLRKVKQQEVLMQKLFGDRIGVVRTDLTSPDAFWRAECWLAYDEALVQRNPATRDLYDWLVPYLNMSKVNTADLFLFWMRDVASKEIPHAMWAGLIAWGQLESRATHGNASDQQHAAMALRTDLFVTADRGLHKALLAARPHYPGRLARCALWPRAVQPAEALTTIVYSISAQE